MANVRSEFRIGLKDETARGVASINRSLDSLKSKAAAASAVLGAIGVGAAAAGLVASARQVVELGAKLDDLSFATGQSVEQLSFLEFAAKRGGTSVETLASSTQRLARNLTQVASGGGKEAAASLATLGLSVDELLQSDIATQIGKIGEALNQIQNPSQRAALGVSLFGEQFKDLAPLVLEGEQGVERLIDRFIELDGVITTKNAKQFAELGDAFDDLALASRSAGVAIAEQLAPPLTSLLNFVATSVPKVGPALSGLGESFDTFLTETALKLERFNLQFEIFKAGLFDSERFQAQAEQSSDAIVGLEEKLRQRRNAGRMGRMEASPSAQRAAILNPLFGAEVATPGDPEEAARSAERAAVAAKRASDALQRESDSVRAFLQDYAREREAAFQREVEQSRDRAQALIAEFATPQEQAIAKLKEIERALGADSETYKRAAVALFDELNPSLEKADEQTRELSASFAELGATFSSAFEDAILSGEKFSDVLVGLGKDVARLLLRATVTDPLANIFKGAFESGSAGGGITDFFKGLFPNSRGGLYKVAGSGGGERPVAFTAQPGEMVAVGKPGDAGGITVNIIGAPSQPRVSSRNVGGRRVIDLAFAEALSNAQGQGMLSQFGLPPTLVAR